MGSIYSLVTALGILFLSAGGANAQPFDLTYFEGRWDFRIYFTGNKSDVPDLSAQWSVAKGLDSASCLMGSVMLKGSVFTRELMCPDLYEQKLLRTVVTNEGSYITLSSHGFQGNRLTWTGTQYAVGQKKQLKEEIEIINEREFVAKFYSKTNDGWRETQREVLKKIPE